MRALCEVLMVSSNDFVYHNHREIYLELEEQQRGKYFYTYSSERLMQLIEVLGEEEECDEVVIFSMAK